jgi:hypothetical protein
MSSLWGYHDLPENKMEEFIESIKAIFFILLMFVILILAVWKLAELIF